MIRDSLLADIPSEGRAALKAGVVGNFIDNVHMFLPVTALAPALAHVAGPAAAAAAGSVVIIAMLLGRPIGGLVFGRLSDRFGRTRTTRAAILGTAVCALVIAAMPTHEVLGVATMVAIIAFRFLGGVFIAGEYSAAIPLAMEWSQPRHRGAMSGLILAMAPCAQGTIAFSVALGLKLLGEQAYADWGWRLLFCLGAAGSIGMLVYYRSHVTDAPVFHRARRQTGDQAPVGARDVLFGRFASSFWQVFVMMSGLWLLTDTTVLILPGRLTTEAGLGATQASIAMGVASFAQAVFMALAGHLSTVFGRRRLMLGWGVMALVLGPLMWWVTATSDTLGRAALCAAVLQVVTVSAYGPVSAYLSERFPTAVRSTGYGLGYSWSLVLPALYPFYLPGLVNLLGSRPAVVALTALGAGLFLLGTWLGPRLDVTAISADLDEVARVA